MSRVDEGHYIKANESTSIPTRHVMLDTEARGHKLDRVELQTWRCGVAAYCRWEDGAWRAPHYARYEHPAEMWADIDSLTQPGRRLVVWAHNLAYDLRISQALKWLGGLGWDLDDIRLSRQGTWARWKRGRRSLVAVDSFAVWAVRLEKIGAWFGMPKLELPAGDDPAEWFDRCERDVQILVHAVTAYLEWLRKSDLGSWQVTGAGQAWSAWRHRHLTDQVLVSDDYGAREAERRGMWTGRAEAWVHGRDDRADVYEWDVSSAYCRIAAETDLPCRQTSVTKGLTVERIVKYSRRWAILAECEVNTEVPAAPAGYADSILWPIGEFGTVLWDPEIRLLSEWGARIRVHRVWMYDKAPILREYARWILGELDKPDSLCPPWQKHILKHWGRSIVGRFAMRFANWEHFGTAGSDDLRIWDASDMDSGDRYQLMQVGTAVRRSTDERYGRDAFPAVTGYVMSEARARLWRWTQLVGPERVLYVDTDSMILDRAGHEWMLAHQAEATAAGWRLKGQHKGYDIIGARRLMLGNLPRVAGVPRGAKMTGDWTFRGEVWDGLAAAVRRGEPDAVRIATRTFKVDRRDVRRLHGSDGRSVPVRLGVDS